MSKNLTGQLVAPQTTELKHIFSGSTIKTTTSIDIGGDGSTFSPTDLFAVSLGACGTTTISMYANKKGISIENIHFEVEKIMSASLRKIEKLVINYYLKTNCSEDDFKRLVGAGKACPVHLTIQNTVEIEESYVRV
jgi:putative redox protein